MFAIDTSTLCSTADIGGSCTFQDLDPSKYRENRIAALKRLSDPYPHKWDVNISIPALIEKYKDIEAGTHLESEPLDS